MLLTSMLLSLPRGTSSYACVDDPYPPRGGFRSCTDDLYPFPFPFPFPFLFPSPFPFPPFPLTLTGANTGIGLETAVDLAKRNARVILAYRSVERGERAVVEVKERS